MSLEIQVAYLILSWTIWSSWKLNLKISKKRNMIPQNAIVQNEYLHYYYFHSPVYYQNTFNNKFETLKMFMLEVCQWLHLRVLCFPGHRRLRTGVRAQLLKQYLVALYHRCYWRWLNTSTACREQQKELEGFSEAEDSGWGWDCAGHSLRSSARTVPNSLVLPFLAGAFDPSVRNLPRGKHEVEPSHPSEQD